MQNDSPNSDAIPAGMIRTFDELLDRRLFKNLAGSRRQMECFLSWHIDSHFELNASCLGYMSRTNVKTSYEKIVYQMIEMAAAPCC